MRVVFQLLPLLPFTLASGIYDLPPVPSQLVNPSRVATFAASVASAKATALSLDNDLGISTGIPNPELPDPCGPPIQAPGVANSSSTCHSEVITNRTKADQAYGATCLNEASAPLPITQELDVKACANAMIQICYALAGSYGEPPTDKWVFTNGSALDQYGSFGSEGGGNCTAGFWLPKGGAPAPSFLRCVDGIFAPLVQACGGKVKNAGSIAGNGGPATGAVETVGYGGSVNLAVLPGFSVAQAGENAGGVDEVGVEGGTGVAVDSGYPSYFIVA